MGAAMSSPSATLPLIPSKRGKFENERQTSNSTSHNIDKNLVYYLRPNNF
jgi:hypothetical protein